ncbi:hypothetical protein XU18_5089 [Perkinsela sp. CCAP 1560/4]|nr:hypothetical protein XU18_5089 [Perkinsela sp. CCAP 1560/4]|eukprot:KNH01721.1 hypothetical protein XU18_5089 [Perkinsela sp. CCAP 1560/4]
MQYACPAWFGIASDTDLATMDSVQARGARLACGLPATTNTYDSLLEANLPPVSEKAKLLAYKSFLVFYLIPESMQCLSVSSTHLSGEIHTEGAKSYIFRVENSHVKIYLIPEKSDDKNVGD